MNFVKSFFLIAIVSVWALAEGVPFSISSNEVRPWDQVKAELKIKPKAPKPTATPEPNQNDHNAPQATIDDDPEGNSGTPDLTLRMKHQAVVNYLQEHLGSRFPKYAEKVTPEFAEKYILEYRLAKDPKRKDVTILSGSLDSDSIKRWLRRFEVRTQGSAGSGLSPLLFVSSDGPYRANETAAATKSGIAEFFTVELQRYFSKINSSLVPYSGTGVSTNGPPRTDAEVRAVVELGMTRNANSAVWLHFSSCPSCGGSRVDLLFFYFPQGRLALGRADDLPFNYLEGVHSDKSKRIAKAAVEEFTAGVNELIEQGTLFSSVHSVVVDGLDSLRAFKQLDNGLSKLDFVTRVTLKKTDATRVEYEVMSGLNTEELAQRLQNNSFPGFRLKTAGTSGNQAQMRYGRGT